MKMNGKNNMLKKNKKMHGTKHKKLHGKTRKNTFYHRKNIKPNLIKSTLLDYTPEVGGHPPIEVQFAKKLAANEPTIRDKAVKKLKKWLMSRLANISM